MDPVLAVTSVVVVLIVVGVPIAAACWVAGKLMRLL
jgi:hypothetical protein